MNILIETEKLIAAVEKSVDSKQKISYLAGLTPITLDRILAGDIGCRILTVGLAADYLGFTTKITFEPKMPAGGRSARAARGIANETSGKRAGAVR